MNIDVIKKAADINKYNNDIPIITNIAERFIYKPRIGAFDSYISVVIRSLSGYYKTFNFPTERAFENALDDLAKNGIGDLKRIKKYTK